MLRSIAVGLTALCGLAGCKFNETSGSSTYDGGFDAFAPQNPLLVATPASADFGMVDVGSRSAAKTVVVANVGPGTTGALGITLSGGGGFSIDTDGCTEMSLATTGSCSVSLRFAPKAVGLQSATLRVSGNPGGDAVVSLSGTGAGTGSLAIAPATDDYGPLAVGSTSAPFTFTVTNKGNAPTGAVTIALTGSDAEQFAAGPDLCTGKSLAPLASCTVAVSASPTTPGSKAATLTAQAAGENGTATASVTMNALAGPTFVINPPSYGFGPVVVGTPPGTGKTFTVENVSGVDAGVLPALALSGPNAQDFAIATNMCTTPLGPMGTCSFSLTFSPTTGMAESATLTASATGATSGQASVSGTGLAPAALTITPSSQPFAPLVQGAPASADVAFQVKNTGAVSTGMLTASLGGTNADQFGLGIDGCTGQTLGASGTCTVNAHFAPNLTGMPGGLQASLQVSGMPGGQTATTLTGTAIAPAHLTVTPTTKALGSVLQGGQGTDFPFLVANDGGATTGPLTVAISGVMMGDFGLGMDGCTGQTLGAAGTCTVYAHFAPGSSSRGAESATLTVGASPGGNVPVTLTGTALAPAQLSIGQSSVPQWTGVGVGTTSAPVTLTVQNSGDLPTGDISFPTSGGDSKDFFAVGPNPCTAPLQAGQSCMFQVEFVPSTAVGTESTTLEATSTTGGTATASLQGTGLWVLTLNMLNDPTMDPDAGQYCYPKYLTAATVVSSDGATCSIVNGASTACTWLYDDGTMITLSQGPTMYGQLTWQGCTPTVGVPNSPCSFSMTTNVDITADYCGHGG
jgi:hypothetical protein